MELIPIEDLERWPVKVIAFFMLFSKQHKKVRKPSLYKVLKLNHGCSSGLFFSNLPRRQQAGNPQSLMGVPQQIIDRLHWIEG